MADPQFDDSAWPIVVIAYPREMSFDEWLRVRDRIISYLRRQTPFGVIADSTSGFWPNAQQRQENAAFFAEEGNDLREYLRGFALVSTAALVRGAVTAIGWIAPPPFSVKVFATVDAARAWVATRVGPAHGSRVSSRPE